jgi:hypothetical protein
MVEHRIVTMDLIIKDIQICSTNQVFEALESIHVLQDTNPYAPFVVEYNV